jgi:hypothetical protein
MSVRRLIDMYTSRRSVTLLLNDLAHRFERLTTPFFVVYNKWHIIHLLPGPGARASSRSVCLHLFIIFFISFREIQKLDGPKSEKLEAPFHELLAFGAIELLDLSKANAQK